MKLSRSALLFAPIALVACMTPNTSLDIAANERLYVDVPFETRVPGDRALFVAPLTDARGGDLPPHENGFPISYGSDQVWDRPVRDMIDEVLARQLDDSKLFAAVLDQATGDGLVMAPSLTAFTTGAVEGISGARSFAEVGLRLKVFGPVDAAGKRVILLDEIWSERQITEPSFKPISPYLLVGSALRTAIQKTLIGLDGSNIGRSYVPVELASPSR